MKSRNEFLVNSAFKTAGDLSHANKQCWRISNVKAIRGRFPYTSTLERQIKSSHTWRCLNAPGKISSSLCQQARKLKTSPFPSPSACIQSMLKNKAKQNRKQSLTLCSYLRVLGQVTSVKLNIYLKVLSWNHGHESKECLWRHALHSNLPFFLKEVIDSKAFQADHNIPDTGQWGTDTKSLFLFLGIMVKGGEEKLKNVEKIHK